MFFHDQYSKRLKLNYFYPALLFWVLFSAVANAGPIVLKVVSEGQAYQVVRLTRGHGVIWGMTFIETNQILFTERSGQLKRLNLTTHQVDEFEGLPAIAMIGQGGLLDIQQSPNYAKDRWIYFTYSKPVADDEGATALARAQLAPDGKLSLVHWQDLLVTQSASDSGQHFGSRITFDDKDHVFFSVGDRGDRDNGQNTLNHAATIIRLNLDGSIPADNPFVGDKKALDEIWSFGHRNPQGLFFDRDTQRLWSIEHGPRGGDELNLIEKGKNYGWPVISYGKEYWGPFSVGEGTEKAGMEQPIKYYVPSIAPSSLTLYRGQQFPQWQGDLFAGALVLTHINRIKLDAKGKAIGEERLVKELRERVRRVIVGPDELFYFSTDSGNIYRIEPLGQSS